MLKLLTLSVNLFTNFSLCSKNSDRQVVSYIIAGCEVFIDEAKDFIRDFKDIDISGTDRRQWKNGGGLFHEFKDCSCPCFHEKKYLKKVVYPMKILADKVEKIQFFIERIQEKIDNICNNGNLSCEEINWATENISDIVNQHRSINNCYEGLMNSTRRHYKRVRGICQKKTIKKNLNALGFHYKKSSFFFSALQLTLTNTTLSFAQYFPLYSFKIMVTGGAITILSLFNNDGFYVIADYIIGTFSFRSYSDEYRDPKLIPYSQIKHGAFIALRKNLPGDISMDLEIAISNMGNYI